MGIITLTTDLGYRDPYLALVKARLLSGEVDPRIIDLSCEVSTNNLSEAAFIVQQALPAFPPETIHLVGIKFIAERSALAKTEVADNTRFLVAKYRNQYIFTPDTGFFTLLDKNFSDEVYQLYYEEEKARHFFLKDILANAALQVLNGKSLSDIGMKTNEYHKALPFESYVNGNELRGRGVYIDDFGNIITNITYDIWQQVVAQKSFTVTLPGTRISKLSQTYDDVRPGSALLLFNSFGYLELAVNGKSAYRMLYPRDIGKHFEFNLIVELND